MVDQSSTDGTYELALEKADSVVRRRAKGFCEPDRNYAAALAHCPYVFLLDDDERLSPELIEILPDLVKTNADIFWFKRANFVDGVDIGEMLGHDLQCRMWKPGAVEWSDIMHQYPLGARNTKVFYVEKPINHFRTFAGLKKSNLSRNAVVSSPDQAEMQTKFVMAVESFLAEKAVNAGA